MTKFTSSILLLLILFLPMAVFAQQSVISLPNPLASQNFEELLDTVINWLLVITAPIVGLLIVYAGFQYMVSGVSPAGRKSALDIIKYAILGYAIILLSKVLVGVITGLFS